MATKGREGTKANEPGKSRPAVESESELTRHATISDAIYEALAKRGRSCYRAASQIGETSRTVQRWADGTREPNIEDVQRLCELLSCDFRITPSGIWLTLY